MTQGVSCVVCRFSFQAVPGSVQHTTSTCSACEASTVPAKRWNARTTSLSPELLEMVSQLRHMVIEFGAPTRYWTTEQQETLRKSGDVLQQAGIS